LELELNRESVENEKQFCPFCPLIWTRLSVDRMGMAPGPWQWHCGRTSYWEITTRLHSSILLKSTTCLPTLHGKCPLPMPQASMIPTQHVHNSEFFEIRHDKLLSVQCNVQHWTEYKTTLASVRPVSVQWSSTRRLRPRLWAQFWTDFHQIWNIASP